jgi:multicomponent Na+:H+ antiporter subunit D
VSAGLAADQYAVVAVSLVVSLLALYSMMRIWTGAFWGEPEVEPEVERDRPLPALMVGSTVAVAGLSIAVALAAGPLYDLCLRAAADLVDPAAYTRAVLGQ